MSAPAPAAVSAARPMLRAAAGVIGFVVLALTLAALVLAVAVRGGASPSSDGTLQTDEPAAAADIPPVYLALYRAAGRRAGLDWSVLAAIGKIESDHGRSPLPGVTAGLNSFGCCAGPMQFNVTDGPPSTWESYGGDGDGDGVVDVYDPADAIPAAARYLAAAGGRGDYRRALLAYNHSAAYGAEVLRQAADYRAAAAAAAANASTIVPAGPGRPDVAAFALRFLGVPYRWGGDDPAGGFDCSGLTQYVWARFGVALAHYTVAQWQAYPHVPRGQELPGDLVFFVGAGGEPPEHMGLYLGGGRFVHAPHTGDVVRVAVLADRSDYMGAVRPGTPGAERG